MRHHNKIILAERRKKFQWHKMKRAGKKTFATFLLPPLSLLFFLLVFSVFSGTLLGGGASRPPSPPPPLGAPLGHCAHAVQSRSISSRSVCAQVKFFYAQNHSKFSI